MDTELLIKTFERFVNSYEIERIINTSEYDRKIFYDMKSNPQYCRFCNKAFPDVKFRTDAHLVPSFLGSKYLLSNFECDDCNSQFKLYENDLANFIGPIRSIVGITGKSKNPKYSKNNLHIFQDDEDILRISSPEILEKIKNGERQITIPSIMDNFIPSNVYKALLKIALCMVSESEIKNFEEAFMYLKKNNEEIQEKMKNSMNILRIVVPGPAIPKFPIIHLFKRKNIQIELPEKVMVIHLKNLKYQIVLPLNKNDNHLAGKTMEVPMCPIILDENFITTYGNFQFESINLSSNFPEKNKEMGIGLNISNVKKHEN